MENDFHRDSPAESVNSPSAAEARDALSGLTADGAKLAERVVTPWWYHVGLGAIVALFVVSQAFPASVSGILIAVGVIAIPVLTITYSRRYGVSISAPAGPRSKRLLLVTLGVIALALFSTLYFKLTGISPWWGILPALIAGGTTLVLGRRYDDALRSEIAGTRAPA